MCDERLSHQFINIGNTNKKGLLSVRKQTLNHVMNTALRLFVVQASHVNCA